MSEPLPFVSICLLTYKRAKFLPRSLDSLLVQTHANFELIINDDNSPDETETVCRAYEKRDPRVRYCRNPTNLRYAGNQNAAIERANSDYVAIVHDGDVYRADLIEHWTRALVMHPSASLVFNAVLNANEQGVIVSTDTHPYPPIMKGCDLFDEMLRVPGSPIFGIVMVRRSAVLAAGPFDLSLPVLADVDMWMRLLLRGDVAYIAEPLLTVSPREKGHSNYPGNWRIREENERIYQLNFRRRFPAWTPEGQKAWRQTKRMLLGQRLRCLLICVKHGWIGDLVRGVTYCFSHPLRAPQ